MTTTVTVELYARNIYAAYADTFATGGAAAFPWEDLEDEARARWLDVARASIATLARLYPCSNTRTDAQHAPATSEVFWPGRPGEPMCPACVARAKQIAEALGFELAVRPVAIK